MVVPCFMVAPGEVPCFMVVPSEHRGRPVLRASPVVAPRSSRDPCSSCGRLDAHGRLVGLALRASRAPWSPRESPIVFLWPPRAPCSSSGRTWSMGVRLSVVRCGRIAVAKMSSRGRSVVALGSQSCFGQWLSSGLACYMVALCSVISQAVLR